MSEPAETKDDQPKTSDKLTAGKVAWWIIGAISISAFVFAVWPTGEQTEAIDENGEALGEPLGEIGTLAFETEEGELSNLNELNDKPLVVNFFASTCAPCRAELPEFELVHQDVKDEIRFVGIDQDLDRSSWKSFIKETGITFETVFQREGQIFQQYGGIGLPATAFISADGSTMKFHAGVLNEQQLRDLIDEHL